MAFLGQLTANVQAHLNSVKPQLNSVLQTASRAKDNLVPMINRASAQLDNLGKMLQGKNASKYFFWMNIWPFQKDGLKAVKLTSQNLTSTVTGERKQSPIDILASITSYDEGFEDTSFNFDYPSSGDFKLINAGESLQMHVGNGGATKFTASILGDEMYHLETVLFHWGTEPMNGSEHTVGGVGYAGEIHFVHKNSRHGTFEQALKEPKGVVTIAVLLNESHDDNPSLAPIIGGITQVIYKGSECNIQRTDLRQLIPPAEKRKEFWVYDGSETIAPYREKVQWIIFRPTISISSHQLDKLRTLRKEGYECEVEHSMLPIRPVQPINGRIVRSSFRSGAQGPPITKAQQ